jgi:NADH-quinone oxidoreductase subunit A
MIFSQGYGILFIQFLAAVAFALTTIAVNFVVSPKAPTLLKHTPYESGMDAIGEAHIKFDAKYYLYALLFILFDIEAIFMFPWAVSFKELGLLGLLEMVVFILILFVGLLYAWRRDALEWE